MMLIPCAFLFALADLKSRHLGVARIIAFAGGIVFSPPILGGLAYINTMYLSTPDTWAYGAGAGAALILLFGSTLSFGLYCGLARHLLWAPRARRDNR